MTNTKYYRLMLGKGSRHAEQCLAERFVGADYGIVLMEQAVTVWEKSAAHTTTNRGRYFHIVVQYDGWI